MFSLELIFVAICTAFVILWLAWIIEYGWARGSLALLLRAIWLLPFLLAFFPETRSEQVPSTYSFKTINVLLDDSESMDRIRLGNDKTLSQAALEILSEINAECARLGCHIKVTRLSEINELTKSGYTPLSVSLEAWLYKTGNEAWILLSDGGDFRPSLRWDTKLKGFGKSEQGANRGLIIGFKPPSQINISVETTDSPVFSFVQKPLDIPVFLARENSELEMETIQVQIFYKDQVLASTNATFAQGEEQVELSVPIPPLSRGSHLLTIKALPTGDEKTIWDNVAYKQVEVLPNTVGILHLLGAPSWDGRFLRRYLKSEPKNDLISFFILRDRNDMQLVSERELSLIPFPVERLFNEELPNFHSVIMQNFALYEFLDYNYQENLVKFVMEGGGLLFIGGSQALRSGDLRGSPLASILPFRPKSSGINEEFFSAVGGQVDRNGPFYDGEQKYKIEMAEPDPVPRSLANVFDDWAEIAGSLSAQEELKGIHRMENVVFKDGLYTPLLNARLPNGEVVPLVVASYPGKGRALWIFSDSFYNLSLNPGEYASQNTYQEFFSKAMVWLLRQELRKPINIREFRVLRENSRSIRWSFSLTGPAARYFLDHGSWKIAICGVELTPDQIISERIASEHLALSGSLQLELEEGAKCDAKIDGNHPAFGSHHSLVSAVVPEEFNDKEVFAAPRKLQKLSNLTGAPMVSIIADKDKSVLQWIEEVTGGSGIGLPSRIEKTVDHFWMLGKWWFAIMLMALPLEAVVRRWPELTLVTALGSRRRRIGLNRN